MPIDGLHVDSHFTVRIDRGEACSSADGLSSQVSINDPDTVINDPSLDVILTVELNFKVFQDLGLGIQPVGDTNQRR